MPMQVNVTNVPLEVQETFLLENGECVVVAAKQATSRKNMARARAMAPKQTFREETPDVTYSLMSPMLRTMYNAFYGSAECDVVNASGTQLVRAGMTMSQYQDVWGSAALSAKRYRLINPDGGTFENPGMVSIHDMIMEVTYRANPDWDPFRDDSTGTTSRQLQSYSGTTTK